MEKNEKANLGAGVVMSYVLLIVDTLISLIYTPILLKNLGDSQFGLYQLMGSMVSYLAIMDLGLGSTMTRYMVKYRTEGDKKGEQNFLAMGIIVYFLIGLIVLAVGTVMYFLLGNIFQALTGPELKDARILFIFMVINFVISLFDHAFSGVLAAYEKFVFEKGLKIARVLIRAVLVIVLLQFYQIALVIVLIELLLTVSILIAKIMLCVKKVKIIPRLYKMEFPLLREVFAFTLAVFLQTVANQFNNNVDKTVLGIYASTTAVAVYSVAMQITSAYSGISTAVESVYFSRISRGVFEKKSDEQITRSLIPPSRLQLMMLSAVCLGFWLFGREFIRLWCNKEEAWLIACLIMTAATLELFQNCTTAVLKAKNLLRGRTIINVFTALANFVITILLVPRYGMLGAAIGTVFTMLVGYGVGNNLYYHYKVGIKLKLFFRETLRGIVPAVLISAIFGIGIAFALPSGSWLWLALKLVIFIIVFLICMWLVGFNKDEKKLVGKIMAKLHIIGSESKKNENSNGRVVRLKKANECFELAKSYLEDGKYVLLPNMRVYCKASSKVYEDCESFLGYQTSRGLLGRILKIVSRKKVQNIATNAVSAFKGTILYINNSMPEPKRIKVFDLENKRVLVIPIGDSEYVSNMHIYEKTSKFFMPPKILWRDDEKKMYIEEFLQSVPRDEITPKIKDDIMYLLADMYVNYLEEYFEQNERQYIDVIDEYGLFNEKVENLGGFAISNQHNDLSSLNIVYSVDGTCNLIDWEHFGENIFFYDVMRLIINDAQQRNDTYRLKEYLKGSYDVAFEKLFKAAGADFYSYDKEYYLKIAYICMVNRGIKDGTSENTFKSLAENFDVILTNTKSTLNKDE